MGENPFYTSISRDDGGSGSSCSFLDPGSEELVPIGRHLQSQITFNLVSQFQGTSLE